MTSDSFDMSLDALAQLCKQESFKKEIKKRDNRYCFELLQRGFGQEDEDALGYILEIYKTIWSKSWVRDAEIFETMAVTADDFKSLAFIKVYQVYKGEAFKGFPDLNRFIGCMHTTLVRTVAEFLRSASAKDALKRNYDTDDTDDPFEGIAAPENPRADVERKLMWEKINARISVLLPEEKMLILFDLWAKQALSRAETVKAYPQFWPSEDTVRKDVQTIKRRLSKDSVVLALLNELRGSDDS